MRCGFDILDSRGNKMNRDEIIEKFPGCQILFDDNLAKYTYTMTGGDGEVVLFPDSIDQLQKIIAYALKEKIEYTILGNASNVIIKDSGLQGFVIFTCRLKEVTVADNVIMAQCGAQLKQVSQIALAHNLTGLEFACGIPGSLGGGIFMNAGAYDGELKGVVTKVKTIDRSGLLREYQGPAMEFGYRTSVFQKNGETIVECEITLEKGDHHQIANRVEQLTYLRKSKQPLEYPSCGSVFRRPEGYYTGKLIQEAKLQGFQIGGAQISKKHAGFIVNVDNASATNYLELIEYIQRKIKQEKGVDLITEVKILG